MGNKGAAGHLQQLSEEVPLEGPLLADGCVASVPTQQHVVKVDQLIQIHQSKT
eukprot:COSAG05_NODE_513_length_9084_cov_5.373957_7_plen_53_part_00